MKRILGLGLLVLTVVVSGCVSNSAGSEGSFELLISDRPAAVDDFEYLKVEFSEARIFSSNNNTVNVKTIGLNSTAPVDLTTVRNKTAQSLVNVSLEPGNYSKIELYVENINASADNRSVEVKVPPGKLMLAKPFEVRPNKTVSFVFDIEVVLRGNEMNNQGYILKPVISESGIAGKDVKMERKRIQKREPERNPQGNNSQTQRGRP